MFGGTVEIGTYTVTDGFLFTDVKDAVLVILEEIYSGKVWKVGEFFSYWRNVSATFSGMAGYIAHSTTASGLLLFQELF